MYRYFIPRSKNTRTAGLIIWQRNLMTSPRHLFWRCWFGNVYKRQIYFLPSSQKDDWKKTHPPWKKNINIIFLTLKIVRLTNTFVPIIAFVRFRKISKTKKILFNISFNIPIFSDDIDIKRNPMLVYMMHLMEKIIYQNSCN